MLSSTLQLMPPYYKHPCLSKDYCNVNLVSHLQGWPHMPSCVVQSCHTVDMHKAICFFPLNLCVYLCYWLQRSWFCSFPRDCFPAEICKSPQVIVHGFCSSECSLHCVSTSLLLRELLVRHFPMGRGCLVGWFSNTRLVSHLCASLGWLCNQHQSRPRLKHTVMLV